MVPIVFDANQEFEYDAFHKYLLDLCRKHHDEQRALAFAFIVYDFEDHTVNQIIKNHDYWSALDKIAGNYLSIFYIDSKDSYYENRKREILQDRVLQNHRPSKEEQISFLVPISIEPSPLDNAVDLIKKQFGLAEELKTPFVIFFQTDGKAILDHLLITLKQERIEDAFIELKACIEEAVNSMSKVLPENYKNYLEIYNLIRGSLKKRSLFKFVDRKKAIDVGIEVILLLVKSFSQT